ncbi:MAG: hypothetical protein LBC75_13675 [Fibromonadaceae bacterium]|jgi:hypothetical protein|nr:hypothetical protein [Fibromonadaceae bacterium]
MRNNISKLALTAAFMLAITFTFSCSGDSDDGGGKQSNISSGKEASVESSSSKGTDKSSSSNEVEDNSSSSSLSSTGSSSSSSKGNSSSSKGSESAVKKDKISGVSQKGPFVKGSTATLYELDDKLVQTGRSFRDIIADDKGSFDIKINVELASPYAMLEADGYYRNEVTGEVSTGTIKLYAIADIREKSNVNVNILTHLEYYRVQKLVEGGKSLQEAKKQAQKEILAVFNISEEFKNSEDMSIFGTTDGDAALLAISILLQGDLTEGKFTERLADFSTGFRETGKWDNNVEKKAMADWAINEGKKENGFCRYLNKEQGNYECWPMPTGDMCETGTLVNTCFENEKPLFAKIRDNILDWNLSSSVPDFEKYVKNYGNNYWNSYLGVCDAKEAGKIKDGPNGTKVICKDKDWALATDYEADTYQWICSKDGDVKKGQSGKEYICKNGNWQQMINCNGGWQERNCKSNAVTLKVDECVEINVLDYTNQSYLPDLLMRCSGPYDGSVTLSLNGKSTTITGNSSLYFTVPLGKIKLGDNEFGSLCLTAISGATSIECKGPSQ